MHNWYVPILTIGKLAEKAKTKQQYYADGVDGLQSEWTRVTALVEQRTAKLSDWNANLAKYEETYGGTLRNFEDIQATIKSLEQNCLEGKFHIFKIDMQGC